MKLMFCICCDKELKNLFEDDCLQPSEGLHFYTYGHYGSTYFDPMDGSTLNVFICDSCLALKKEKTVEISND